MASGTVGSVALRSPLGASTLLVTVQNISVVSMQEKNFLVIVFVINLNCRSGVA